MDAASGGAAVGISDRWVRELLGRTKQEGDRGAVQPRLPGAALDRRGKNGLRAWHGFCETKDCNVRTVRNILLSILLAALAFLAVWILTVNLDVTWHSFSGQEATRRAVFRLGFQIATAASAVVFLVALYRLHWPRARTKP